MTQTTSQVEAAEREKFEAWWRGRDPLDCNLDRREDGSYLFGRTQSVWQAWLARAAIASQQEVAAPVGEAEIEQAARMAFHPDLDWSNDGNLFASAVQRTYFHLGAKWALAAARVPVASPAVSDEEADALANLCYTSLLATGYNGGMGGLTWDRALVRMAVLRTATPPVGAGGAGVMDARPDSVHSDSGECDRVQGPGPTDTELLDWLERHFTDISGNYENDTGGVTSFYIDCELDGSDLIRSTIRAAILAKGGDRGEGK